MGIVITQSFKNMLSTYLGFGIGAVNTLFLYPYFLSDVYYGLVSYLLAVAVVMMPLLTFGVHNTLIKFFFGYDSAKEKNGFMAMMLFLPLLIIIPAGAIGFLAYEWILTLLSQKNAIVKDYLWMTYIIAFAMAYFEIFYAWARVNMKSVFGNFLKEVFNRIVIMALLFLVFLDRLSVEGFIYGIMAMYVFRMLLMLFGAVYAAKPRLIFKLPSNAKAVISYSTFVILAGIVSTALLDIDKFMIGQFKTIENVAFYNVAVFIAMVIAVPARGMHQIVTPLTAKLLSAGDHKGLQDMYKRSSINLYVIGSFIFLLIILNINELYKLIPEQYSSGLWVVFLIASARLFDNLLGNNTAILFNSKYYKTILLFGLLLAVLTVCLNLVFIPLWGINGAATATLLAFVIYNTVKIWFVKVKFGMHPFSPATLKTTGILIVLLPLFYFWDFSFHPIWNIVLKSLILAVLFAIAVAKFRLSEDLNMLLKYVRMLF